MTRIYNKAEVKIRRQNLRNDMSGAEILMWARLRRKQMNVRFRRQYSVGPYIVDFYCPEFKLALEIDGDTHLGHEAENYDVQRQTYIEALGIQFLRFTNDEVVNKIEEVIKTLSKRITELKTTPCCPP
jgi:very-short-patch-repair endonuclease